MIGGGSHVAVITSLKEHNKEHKDSDEEPEHKPETKKGSRTEDNEGGSETNVSSPYQYYYTIIGRLNYFTFIYRKSPTGRRVCVEHHLSRACSISHTREHLQGCCHQEDPMWYPIRNQRRKQTSTRVLGSNHMPLRLVPRLLLSARKQRKITRVPKKTKVRLPSISDYRIVLVDILNFFHFNSLFYSSLLT